MPRLLSVADIVLFTREERGVEHRGRVVEGGVKGGVKELETGVCM